MKWMRTQQIGPLMGTQPKDEEEEEEEDDEVLIEKK